VFKWYQSDFGQTEGEVLAFVAKFFPEGSAEQNIISNYLTRYRTPHAATSAAVYTTHTTHDTASPDLGGNVFTTGASSAPITRASTGVRWG
jgi:hypothetical protein